jgi:transcriptional regulator with XRE-family HTH domain
LNVSEHAGENLRRLMAADELSIHDVSARTGLDARTIRAISRGTHRPHARTLHRLASGLGVAVDEFFVDPAQLLYRRFDHQTNPLVEEVLQDESDLFDGWCEADFDELHSRVGTGGALTREGVLQAVERMNDKRRMHDMLDVLLESSQARTVAGMIDLLYQQVIVGHAIEAVGVKAK